MYWSRLPKWIESIPTTVGVHLSDYAIVRTGGKQYRVRPGDVIRTESLPYEFGDNIQLEDVLMVSSDGEVTVGAPTVPGAKVSAQVVGQGRDEKVVVLKYKPKTRYRRRNGHRQSYIDLKINRISTK